MRFDALDAISRAALGYRNALALDEPEPAYSRECDRWQTQLIQAVNDAGLKSAENADIRTRLERAEGAARRSIRIILEADAGEREWPEATSDVRFLLTSALGGIEGAEKVVDNAEIDSLRAERDDWKRRAEMAREFLEGEFGELGPDEVQAAIVLLTGREPAANIECPGCGGQGWYHACISGEKTTCSDCGGTGRRTVPEEQERRDALNRHLAREVAELGERP